MVDLPNPESLRRPRAFTLAICALGHQLKDLARSYRKATRAPVTPPASPTHLSQEGGTCLLPWQTLFKPLLRNSVIIDAHRDDWP